MQGVVGTNDRHQHGRRRKDRRRSDESAAFIFNHGTDGSLNGESGPVSDERNIFRYRSSGFCKRCHDLPGVVWYLLADQQTGSEKSADSAGTGL